MKVFLFLSLLAAAAFGAVPSALNYQPGVQMVFNLTSQVDARGVSQGNAPSSGSFATMQSTVVVECTQVTDDGFLFAMNMFNTFVSNGQTENLKDHKNLADDDNGSLGDDMYFLQAKNGTILNVWYEEDDSPYFVSVKSGAINAFQTMIVPGNGSPVTALVSDVVGVHTAQFVGSAGASLTVMKSFNQADFKSFADPTVTPTTFLINGQTSTVVSAAGVITGATVSQTSVYVSATASSSSSSSSSSAGPSTSSSADMSGFATNLRSAGQLTVVAVQGSTARLASKSRPTASQLAVSPSHKKGSLADVASQVTASLALARTASLKATAAELTSLLHEALSGSDSEPARVTIPRLRAAAERLAASAPADAVAAVTPFLAKASLGGAAAQRKRALYLVALWGTPAAQELLVKFGLHATNPAMRYHAIMAAASLANPTFTTMDAVSSIATEDKDANVRRSALGVLGALLTVSQDLPRVQQGSALLVRLLQFALVEEDQREIDAVLRAIANAGPLVDRASLPPLPARKFSYAPHRRATTTVVSRARTAPAAGSSVSDSPLPFNRTFDVNVALGGKVLGASFSGDLLAGTNFNCNTSTFNYEGYANANATAWLFGYSQSAFVATAEYGKIGGAPLADELSLSVWGKTVFSQQIPQVDCSPHTFPIAHASPGFSVTHTLWVSVIPVVFTASADLDLSASYTWTVCDSTLTASVSVNPTAALVFSGGATVDLLIVRAGVALSSSLNTAVVPEAAVKGSLCEIELDATQVNDPMDASLVASYAAKKCKYWIFDCKWGDTHSRTLWQWNAPSQSKTLFDKIFKIAKN